MKSEKYMLDKRGFLAKAALVFLLLSAIVRVVGGFLNRAALMEDRFMQVEFLLPIVCGVLLMICIPAFGKRGFWLSAIPVVCLCMAYVLRLFSYDNLLQVELPMRHVLPGIFGCMVLAAAYSATVFGARTKWLLFLLFVAALGGHVWFELVPAFREGGWFSVSPALMELSWLLLFGAMLLISAGLTRKLKVRAVKADSGKDVVPPIPGNKLDDRPPVASEKPAPAAEPSGPVPSAEPEKPEPVPSAEPEKPEPVPEPVWSAPATESAKAEAERREEAPTAPEEEEYDPFAPSTGPIQLTLNPVGFSVETEKEASEADDS